MIDPEKIYCYLEQNQEDIQQITVREILDQHWEHWKKLMIKIDKQDQISEEGCLADWCVGNWAWPLNKTGEW